MAEPARLHNQAHGGDRDRASRSPVPPRPVMADVARDPLLGGAVAAPPAPFAVLGRADAGARGRAMRTLQRRHGNAGVGQLIWAARLAPSRPPIAIRRCGHGPCDCPPERKAAHAAAEITAIGNDAGAHAESAMGAELQRRAGGGQPLDPVARARLEPAMGLDLSAVSIHADAGADVLARAVAAEAFTTGNDIYFRAGRYQPRSEGGLRLLAHEITHTAQQGRGAVAGAQRFGSVRVNEPGDDFEREAEQSASATMARIADGPIACSAAALRPLARIPRGADAPIQRRATAINQPPFNVTFDPSVVVRTDPAPPNVGRFDANPFRETLNVTPGSSGFIVFPIDMTWRRAVPGTPGGGGGGGPPNQLNCDLIPDETAKQACKAGQDPKAFLRSLTLPAICGLLALTGVGAVVFGPLCTVCLTIAAISALTGGGLPNFCQNALNSAIGFLSGLLGGGGGGGGGGTTPPTPAGEDRGTGRATLETRFVVGADGKMQLFGPPPRSESNGVAAEVVSPVQFSQETIGSNGHLSIQPLIRSQISRTRPNGEVVPETHTFQRMFEVDLVLPPPPSPVGFCCGTQLFPFKIAKDTFVDEGAQQNKLLTWVRTQDPRVISGVRAGQIPVIIAGRASTTGSFEFNLKLSEDRARRAEQMVKDFFGSDAAVRTFAFGELTAPPPDAKERDEERRADIKITAEIAPPAPVCGTGSTEEACAGTSPVPAAAPVTGGGPVGEAVGGGGGTGSVPDAGPGSGGGASLVVEEEPGGPESDVAPGLALSTEGIQGNAPQDEIGALVPPPVGDQILDQGAGTEETPTGPEQILDDGGTVEPGVDAGASIEELLADFEE